MPRLRKKLPVTLLMTTSAEQPHAFQRRRADSDVIVARARRTIVSVAGNGNRGGPAGTFGFGDELLAFRAQRHVLAGLLVQAAALVAVENGLPDDAPGDARPEEIFAVKPLDPFHQVGAIQSRVRKVRKLVAGFVGHRA